MCTIEKKLVSLVPYFRFTHISIISYSNCFLSLSKSIFNFTQTSLTINHIHHFSKNEEKKDKLSNDIFRPKYLVSNYLIKTPDVTVVEILY